MERSGAGFHCENFYYRFYVWKRLQYYVYLAGATLSLIVMVFVKNKIGFGQLGVSVAGGVSHNIGQLLVAIPATHTVGLLYYYAPALMVSGVITGLLIGVLTKEVLKRIP